MTAPYPQGEQTEAVIAAGMAAGDTDAAMRAVAASEVVVPQTAEASETDLPDGSMSLPVIEQDGTSYVPVVHLGVDDERWPPPTSTSAVSVQRRRARAPTGRPTSCGSPSTPAPRTASACRRTPSQSLPDYLDTV